MSTPAGLVRQSIAGAVTLAVPVAAQHAPASSCRQTLDFVVAKLETNYPGYPDKVTAATRARYEAHTADARARADTAAGDSSCQSILIGWAAFFREGHIGIRYRPAAGPSSGEEDPPPAALRGRFASAPARTIRSSDTLRFRSALGSSDPIEDDRSARG